MKKDVIERLESIVGKTYVVSERERIQNYLADESADIVRPRPASDLLLVRPANTQDVSNILRLANESSIPVFPRGGGTGLVGGAIPTQNGLILAMERMNRIEIDRENLMAVAEAGVTLETLSKSASDAGLFFPLHPGDETSQVGGLVATNAGGARAIKHGVMRNYVRGMEVVLPTGEILRLGGKLHKNNVGYDFMQFITGSEGTLAVITKVTLRLLPMFGATATLIFPYNDRNDAIASVPKMIRDGRTPLSIEYAERDLMERTAKHLGENWPVKSGNCYLMIVIAESSREQVLSESMKIAETCQQMGALEPLFVEPRSEQDRILRIRSNTYPALKSETADILDVTVPVSELAKLVNDVEELAKKENVFLPAYGHAADGNLHVHIMKGPTGQKEHVERLRDEIYRTAVRLGGVITGEHGIGKIRTGKLESYMTEKEIELMKNAKRVFDPNNILNPGAKVLV